MSRPADAFPWLVYGALVAHVLEELPAFPAWATAHFGTTSTQWFILSHIPLLGVAAWICGAAARPSPSLRAQWWLWVLLSALLTNGIFHIGATVLFREYSPGLATVLCLYLPLGWFAWARQARPAWQAPARGVVMAAALTGSLWLDIPV